MPTKIDIVDTQQEIFDGFNKFILSKDTKVFGKLLARSLLMEEVKDVPGDIVECGVFKGTGLFTFLKLKRYLNPNSIKKVIGFDFFNSKELLNSLSGTDKDFMGILFNSRNAEHTEDSCDLLRKKILESGFLEHEFDLVKGDVCETTHKYVEDKPGLKISLLYIDLDIERPTYEALKALWPRISSGGMVVFDEYAFHNCSEAAGADKFFSEIGVQIKNLNYICPTAYVKKP